VKQGNLLLSKSNAILSHLGVANILKTHSGVKKLKKMSFPKTDLLSKTFFGLYLTT
jgi:hypothetical protein